MKNLTTDKIKALLNDPYYIGGRTKDAIEVRDDLKKELARRNTIINRRKYITNLIKEYHERKL